ncbi:MAG: zinc ribbon domain-containing protein [Conexivisphaerales archaeon]
MGIRLAYGTSKTCSRCGYYNKGEQAHSNCGLIIDRQENAAKNIWNKFLSMWGVVGSPRKEPSSMSSPMNPEEDNSDKTHELSMYSIHIHT